MASRKRGPVEVEDGIEASLQRAAKIAKTEASAQAAVETNSDTSYVSAAAAIFSEGEEDDDTPGSSELDRDSELSTSSEDPSSDEDADSSEDEEQENGVDVAARENDTGEIINVRPGSKPNITGAGRDVGLKDKLKNFLSEMQQADKVLSEERRAGTLDSRNIEACEEGKPHVEMNLGLGVLEEKRKDGSSDSESMSDESESDHKRDIMQNLKGQDFPSPRAKIQEVSDD